MLFIELQSIITPQTLTVTSALKLYMYKHSGHCDTSCVKCVEVVYILFKVFLYKMCDYRPDNSNKDNFDRLRRLQCEYYRYTIKDLKELCEDNEIKVSDCRSKDDYMKKLVNNKILPESALKSNYSFYIDCDLWLNGDAETKVQPKCTTEERLKQRLKENFKYYSKNFNELKKLAKDNGIRIYNCKKYEIIELLVQNKILIDLNIDDLINLE